MANSIAVQVAGLALPASSALCWQAGEGAHGSCDSLDARPNAIRALIVSHVRLYRDGLALSLAQHPQIVVVGAAAGRDDALPRIHELHATVVVVDAGGAGALELVRDIRNTAYSAKVVALAVPNTHDAIVRWAEAGVAGYVSWDAALADLVATLESVARGELRCSPRVAAVLLEHVRVLATALPQFEHATLTWREREIVTFFEDGLSNKEIAGRLRIEVATVKNHVHNVLKKLQVSRRGQAAALVRSGLMRPRQSGAPPQQI
jgi:DNA-binding NarL/FixJ family response regulator